MLKHVIYNFKRLIPLLLIVSNIVAANVSELDKAVKIYYAGNPDQAINLIQPLALSGDVDAQYLLGNILYSLSNSNKFKDTYDPIKWYQMAAIQNSPGANYALGVIYHNKSTQSHRKENVAKAISYYEKAIELGYGDAKIPLSKLKSQGTVSHKSKSLTYNNASFGLPNQALQLLTYSISKQSSTVDITGKAELEHAEHASIIPVKIEDDKTVAITTKETTKHEHATQKQEIQTPVKKSNEASSTFIIESTANLDRSIQTSQAANGESSQLLSTVYLADIANQCNNYTQSGFNYYAETIKDTFFVGNAEVNTIVLTSSDLNTYSINLIYIKLPTVISLDLNGVPKAIAVELKEGLDFRVTGVVEDSRMNGSNCDITLTYQAAQ